MQQNIVVPIARLLIQKSGSIRTNVVQSAAEPVVNTSSISDLIKAESKRLVVLKESADEAAEDGTDFFELVSKPDQRLFNGNVAWAVSEEGVVGTMTVELHHISFQLASQFRPHSVVFLELGYEKGGIAPRTVFWGQIDEVVPRRVGAEVTFTMTARSSPWNLHNKGTNYSARDVDALTILEELMNTAGYQLNPSPYDTIFQKVVIPRWTSEGTLAKSIYMLFQKVKAKTGVLFGLSPDMGGHLLMQIIPVAVSPGPDNKEGTPDDLFTAVEFGNVTLGRIDLDVHAFNSAGVRATRMASDKFGIFDSVSGTTVNVNTAEEIDTDGNIVVYEYDISTPTDPRIVIGIWMAVYGLPVGTSAQPAIVNIMAVTHQFGEENWETTYNGPMLGKTVPPPPPAKQNDTKTGDRGEIPSTIGDANGETRVIPLVGPGILIPLPYTPVKLTEAR